MTKLQQLTERINHLLPEKIEIMRSNYGITLEDVLKIRFEIDSQSFLTNEDEMWQLYKIYNVWELNTPLHLQSEETITFLWELLCNNSSK